MRRNGLWLWFLAVGVLLGGAASATAQAPAGAVDRSIDCAELPGVSLAEVHRSGEIVVSNTDVDQYLPDVAYCSNHSEYLVVWHNVWPVESRDIRGARIGQYGQVLDTFVISEGLHDRAQPSVAYDPASQRYLVVYAVDAFGDGSDWDIYGRFIPWDGPEAATIEFPIVTWETKQWNPKVVYGSTQNEFMVVWWTEHPSVPAYTSGRRVAAAGGFPDNAFTIAVDGSENRVNPDIAYNVARNEYLVVTDNGVDVFGTRLRGDGQSLGGGEFGIAGWPSTESHPSVAACRAADTYLVGWQSLEGADYNIFARYVDGDGTPQSVHQIDATTGDEIAVDVSANHAGTQFMLAWQTLYASDKYGIWARTASTQAELGEQFVVVHATNSRDRTAPAVAGGHSGYMTVWEHDREVSGQQDIHGLLTSPHALQVPLVFRNR